MIYLYLLVSVLTDGFLTYLIYQYYHLLYPVAKLSKRFELSTYVLFWCVSTLLPLLHVNYYVGWGLKLLLCLGLTFIYQSKTARRVLSTILLITVMLAVEYFLIRLSGRIHLGLFTPPRFNATFGLILYAVILWLLFLPISFLTEYRQNHQTAWIRWISSLMTPISILLLVGFSLLVDINVLSRGSKLQNIPLFAEVNDLDLTFYIGSAILLLLNVILFFLYDRSTRVSRLQMENNMIVQQNDSYQKQLEILQNSGAAVKSTRHDMKNHLTVIQGLIQKGRHEEVHDYMERILANLNSSDEISASGYPVIDSLINYKFFHVGDEGISFNHQIQIPADLHFDAYNLTLVLGNLIDNALEAVRKEGCSNKEIHLSIAYKQGCLIIKIKNTYDGIVKAVGDRLATTKSNPGVHGLGLRNVEDIVQKSGGIFDVKYDEEWFSVSVALNCNANYVTI